MKSITIMGPSKKLMAPLCSRLLSGRMSDGIALLGLLALDPRPYLGILLCAVRVDAPQELNRQKQRVSIFLKCDTSYMEMRTGQTGASEVTSSGQDVEV
eukprot:bmy_14249T0